MASALENWVDCRQAGGKYTFLRQAAIAGSGLSPEAAKKALQRLVRRGRIAKAKDYFFVIVPLEYSVAGGPPASWFVHDLMAAMGRRYYVGLLTAAALHGASHHQPQEFQVMTDRPIRPIEVGRARIRFFATRFVGDAATTNVKTPTGFMCVATPETTAVDLVRFRRWVGQLDNVATVIADLANRINAHGLLAAVKIVGDLPNAQRLGYILDRVGGRKLTDPLRRWVEHQSPRPVFLQPTHGDEAKPDRRWHVLVDHPLEIEA
jgi:predicted transcriptional regulator of viral defense system